MTDAPASFALVPGAAASPVILHVPHSSREIPAGVRSGHRPVRRRAGAGAGPHDRLAHRGDRRAGRRAGRPHALAVREPGVAAGGRPGAVPGRTGGDGRRRDGRRVHADVAPRGAAPCGHGPRAADRAVLPAVRAGHDRGGGRPARGHRTGRDRRRALLSGPAAPLRTARRGPAPARLPGHRRLPHAARAARRGPEAFAPAGRPAWTARSAERTYRWTSTARGARSVR